MTFDDAYLSVPELALPVLADLGVPATVFVPTDHADRRSLRRWPGISQWLGTPWEQELCGAGWEELSRLVDSGWEIGSHTRTHRLLTELPDAALREELAGSRQDCLDATGLPCDSIAYPYGEADTRVAAAAKEAGYRAGALLTDSLPPLDDRAPDPMMCPRLGVYEKDRRVRLRLKSEVFLHAGRFWNLAQTARGALRR